MASAVQFFQLGFEFENISNSVVPFALYVQSVETIVVVVRVAMLGWIVLVAVVCKLQLAGVNFIGI